MLQTKSKSKSKLSPSSSSSPQPTTRHNRHLNTSHTSTSSRLMPSTSTTTRSFKSKSQQPFRRPSNRIKHVTNQISPMSTTASMSTTSKSEAVRLYTKDQPTFDNFDYVVVGAGSGGIASARRAASYGAKVAVINMGPLGGMFLMGLIQELDCLAV